MNTPCFSFGTDTLIVRRCLLVMLPLAMLSIVGSANAADSNDEKLTFFESKIRPVLVKHCYECHAADSKEVKGSLLVDSAQGLLTGGDSGAAIVAGKPEESLLLEAMKYEGYEMPPQGRLPDTIIADFEKWISQGAVDPRAGEAKTAARAGIDIEKGREFWAFQPLQTPTLPRPANADWARSPIDLFVLDKLEQAGLSPAADADRIVLARRLYYDLVGLPPTVEQLNSFLNDRSPLAFEKLVDQLLESPQFGVHWGRHWLDVARYADSNGADFNATFHDAWRFRDYVVDAVNADKPFDQFIREQIAGDLLPYDSEKQRTENLVASGFLMLGTKMLSERDKEKLTMDVVDEQIGTVTKAFLGLTVECARCHDHKFDPIPTADYYALAGIFRSTRTLEGESQQYVSTWPRTTLPAPAEHVEAVTKYEKAAKELASSIKVAKKQVEAAKTNLASAKENKLTIDNALATLTGDWEVSTHTPNFIGAGYLHDKQAGKGDKAIRFPVDVSRSGLYEVRIAYTPGSNRAKQVPVDIECADGIRTVHLDQSRKPDLDGLFSAVGQFRFEAARPASITISNRETVGFVIADAVQLHELNADKKDVGVELAAASLEAVHRAEAEVKQAAEKLSTLEKSLKTLTAGAPEPLPKAFAVTEKPVVEDCRLHIRGEHKNLGDPVPRGVLQVALTGESPEFPSNESGRRELAEWIASESNPLTARVLVNRLWYHLIGEGIVASVDNFGVLGNRPTHPELLDYLAQQFLQDGWSIKKSVRRIVLSRTYQMSSQHDESRWQKDPENQLLWRANRRRLPAEAVRDSMLQNSGQLDLTPGGSPVMGLGTLVTQNTPDSKYERKGETFNRSLYMPIIRGELPAMLVVFDFADPDLVTGKRSQTTVPAQALLLLNSPFVLECAKRTAQQVSAQTSDDRSAIELLYQTLLSRTPTDGEVDRALSFLEASENSNESASDRLTRVAHVLYASTEYRFVE